MAILFLGLAVAAVYLPGARIVFLVVLLFFMAPWLVRNQMVNNCELVSKLLRITGLALLGLAFVGKLVKQAIPKGQEMTFTLILFAILGLYMGAYFWLLSDERIERRQ